VCIYFRVFVCKPPKKRFGSGFSTPYTFFCLICTMRSELYYFSDESFQTCLFRLSFQKSLFRRVFSDESFQTSPLMIKLGLISAGLQWTGSTPTGFQEAFLCGKTRVCVCPTKRERKSKRERDEERQTECVCHAQIDLNSTNSSKKNHHRITNAFNTSLFACEYVSFVCEYVSFVCGCVAFVCESTKSLKSSHLVIHKQGEEERAVTHSYV